MTVTCSNLEQQLFIFEDGELRDVKDAKAVVHEERTVVPALE